MQTRVFFYNFFLASNLTLSEWSFSSAIYMGNLELQNVTNFANTNKKIFF